jgi:Pyruvate/2-oxoacid:ferredoxin oxidoreductase gamma subunit
LYGVGAAGVVTAIIIMATKGGNSSKSVALAPVVGPDAVGAVVHYTY